MCAAFMVCLTQEFDMNQYIDRVATSVAACFIIQIELLLSIFFTKKSVCVIRVATVVCSIYVRYV